MSDRERLQLVLWWSMVLIALVGFAFALGTWAGEKLAMEEMAPPAMMQEGQCAAEKAGNPSSGAVRHLPPEGEGRNGETDCHGAEPLTMTGEAEVPLLDPLCEDTYLIADHPLPLELQAALYGACLEAEVDFRLALAVIEQETGYRNLIGDGGDSLGYMQVQEKWHGERMEALSVSDLMDPEGNFRVGCHFLRECIDKYGLERGLGYYNSGEAKVTSYSWEVIGRMG